MWGALHQHGIAESTVMWNAFAFHPHEPGNSYSNRAPTQRELQDGRYVLQTVLDHFQGVKVVPVGKVAERTLRGLGVSFDTSLAHPSMGGAPKFRAGLSALVGSHG
jgi:transposase InsO family protein